MAYSQEVVRRARNRLADRKKMHEQQQEQRLQEAYRQLPRLREIDRQLRATMVTVARTALDSGAQAAFARPARKTKPCAGSGSGCWPSTSPALWRRRRFAPIAAAPAISARRCVPAWRSCAGRSSRRS